MVHDIPVNLVPRRLWLDYSEPDQVDADVNSFLVYSKCIYDRFKHIFFLKGVNSFPATTSYQEHCGADEESSEYGNPSRHRTRSPYSDRWDRCRFRHVPLWWLARWQEQYGILWSCTVIEIPKRHHFCRGRREQRDHWTQEVLPLLGQRTAESHSSYLRFDLRLNCYSFSYHLNLLSKL